MECLAAWEGPRVFAFELNRGGEESVRGRRWLQNERHRDEK